MKRSVRFRPIADIAQSRIFILKSAMTWENQYRRWVKETDESPYDDRGARGIIIETRKAARNGGFLDNSQEWNWVESALHDDDRRHFVSVVFNKQAAPAALATLMLTIGVKEQNPSTNRLFIEPAVKAMGARRVMNRLLELLRNGSDDEKGGAASAAYWVKGDSIEASYAEARARFRDEMLRQFVATESVFVRQRIIPSLSMKSEDYTPDVAPLISNAIRIARTHSDPYIRHRVEVQLGEVEFLRPLPHKKRPPSA